MEFSGNTNLKIFATRFIRYTMLETKIDLPCYTIFVCCTSPRNEHQHQKITRISKVIFVETTYPISMIVSYMLRYIFRKFSVFSLLKKLYLLIQGDIISMLFSWILKHRQANRQTEMRDYVFLDLDVMKRGKK